MTAPRFYDCAGAARSVPGDVTAEYLLEMARIARRELREPENVELALIDPRTGAVLSGKIADRDHVVLRVTPLLS